MIKFIFKTSLFFIFSMLCIASSFAQTKYYISNVSIKCIEKTEAKLNDLVYLKLFSKDCGIKSTATKAFKNGDLKVYEEINLDDLSKKNGWCVKENDVFKVFEDDDLDEDDILFEIKFSKEDLLKKKFSFQKNLLFGKYEISFELKAIKL
jgi:hypothetical protein